MVELNDLHIAGVGDIQGLDNLANSLQILCVIRDNQGIGTRTHIDCVVGADQGSEYSHQIISVLVLDVEDLGHDLTATRGTRVRQT